MNKLAKIAKYFSIFSAVNLSRFAKISFIVGSRFSFFSLINITGPIAGILGGLSGIITALISRILINIVFFKLSVFTSLISFLPHSISSLYWINNTKNKNLFFNLFIPLINLIIFSALSIKIYSFSSYAWVYSLFWLMPISISLLNKFYKDNKYLNNKFLLSLGTTFCAHSVGSVTWLISGYLSNNLLLAKEWLALMPIVLIERVLFASGIYLVYAIATYWITNKKLILEKLKIGYDAASRRHYGR